MSRILLGHSTPAVSSFFGRRRWAIAVFPSRSRAGGRKKAGDAKETKRKTRYFLPPMRMSMDAKKTGKETYQMHSALEGRRKKTVRRKKTGLRNQPKKTG
jgi:hypothetical protein